MSVFGSSPAEVWLKTLVARIGFSGPGGSSTNWAHQLTVGYFIYWLDSHPIIDGIEKAIRKFTFSGGPLEEVLRFANMVRTSSDVRKLPIKVSHKPGEGPFYGATFHFGVVAT